MKILVTGAAGYIAGFMVKRLLDDKHEVIAIDSLERGHKSIDPRATFMQGDLCDKAFVDRFFSENKVDGVIHFAAYISMGESMENPYIYFHNNIMASLNIIEVMRVNNINNFIFSSTAGVYGNPVHIPIPEGDPKSPENPYGESKLLVERLLAWYAKTKGLNYVVLRYFNAAGAAIDGSMGEEHDPESHLIPNVMKAVLENRPFKLFGSDYATPDGTCVRDYIHVLDLVEAHLLALKKLEGATGGFTYNVGTGKGYSNKEVVEMIKTVVGKDFPVEVGERRPGDANELVADVTAIKRDLGFSAKYSDLKTIVESSWKWHSSHQK